MHDIFLGYIIKLIFITSCHYNKRCPCTQSEFNGYSEQDLVGKHNQFISLVDRDWWTTLTFCNSALLWSWNLLFIPSQIWTTFSIPWVLCHSSRLLKLQWIWNWKLILTPYARDYSGKDKQSRKSGLAILNCLYRQNNTHSI